MSFDLANFFYPECNIPIQVIQDIQVAKNCAYKKARVGSIAAFIICGFIGLLLIYNDNKIGYLMIVGACVLLVFGPEWASLMAEKEFIADKTMASYGMSLSDRLARDNANRMADAFSRPQGYPAAVNTGQTGFTTQLPGGITVNGKF